MNRVTDKLPWHRQPLVWMLIALPSAVVVAGFITLYLAISSDDGLVEDDYYQRGKEINRVLDRDQAALRYGLQAQLRLQAEGEDERISLELSPGKAGAGMLPERLTLKLLHATRSGQDVDVSLVRMPDGLFHGVLPRLAQGRWYLQLADSDWRLTGDLHIPRDREAVLAPSH